MLSIATIADLVITLASVVYVVPIEWQTSEQECEGEENVIQRHFSEK